MSSISSETSIRSGAIRSDTRTGIEPHGLWALLDCNNFYASCERLFRPDLIGRPIVVLSNNDGCIVSRSAEAKALGIPMGEPEYLVRPFLKRCNAVVFSSNYALYGDLSARIMNIASTLTPRVDVYSIDEAFLFLEGALASQAEASVSELRDRILRWTGIEVSVGIAPTRTLAKLASRLAKKQGGVFRARPGTADLERVLTGFPVSGVWGIGRHQSARLASRGVTTAAGLRDMDETWLRKNLTVTGWRTALELRGMSCFDEDALPSPQRTLIASRSFGTRVRDKEPLFEALSTFTARAAVRLRKKDLLTTALSVHIATARHGNGPHRAETATIALAAATSDTGALLRAAAQGLEAVFLPGFDYVKAGITLHDLSPRTGRQGNLLQLNDEASLQKRERLMAALDAVNARFGRQTLRHAAEGPDNAPWHMRSQHCSPRATTHWEELPPAVCRD